MNSVGLVIIYSTSSSLFSPSPGPIANLGYTLEVVGSILLQEFFKLIRSLLETRGMEIPCCRCY